MDSSELKHKQSKKRERSSEDAVVETSMNQKLSKKEKKRLRRLDNEDKKVSNEEPTNFSQDTSEEFIECADLEEKTRIKESKKETKRLKKLAEQVVAVTTRETEDSPIEEENAPRAEQPRKSKKSKTLDSSVHSSSENLEEINAFRQEHSIQVYPEEIANDYVPIMSFSSLYPQLEKHCPYIVEYLKKKNFKIPSPIQAQCWPPLLQGKDAIGIAATGSGKTLAFLIPALLKIAQLGVRPRSSSSIPSPRVLVVSPTRELAAQSHEVAVELNGPLSVCIYGGVPKHVQKSELKQGADIVVATPGRLLDLIDEGALSLGSVCYLVLDEADRMLDDGFEPAIRKIVSSCPSSLSGIGKTGLSSIVCRQTVMFSATWPEEIRALADTFLSPSVVRVVVGSTELSANHRVRQIVECIENYDKNKRLIQLLDTYHKSRTNRCLIFVLYKKEAVVLLNTLQGKGYNVTAIHGDRSQNERTAALETFKRGDTPLLIATDVAARGLDIPQVEYVINYSFPLTVEDYVHRIGRTGRGGATGVSHTFFSDQDKGLAGALVNVLKEANQDVPQEIFKYQMVTKKKQSKLYGEFGPKAELAGKKASKIVFED